MRIKILNMILSLIFLISGVAKLFCLTFEVAAFERWGYALWFMYLIGTIEVVGGLGLLVNRLSALAAVTLAIMMTGAVITHMNHAEWGMLVASSIILSLTTARGWFGRDDIRALVRYVFSR
ncbi:DoxX family protein [Aeromonas enteropelogenes]|uniref:DoxX family protein n=1 Tax=Aeromonas enteropelogenes TaxID=29489 RepID=UPI00228684E4|nr:DoxX family protein [Aeromonas enteropelogenes]MCZ0752229.1 DoxX family protein [Aeromonas enteropelogenes]